MTGVELTQEEREAVDRMSRVFGWQHLARYSGKSSEWLSLTLGAMARAALHAAESEVARLTRERAEVESILDAMGDPTDPTFLHPQAASLMIQIRAALGGTA